MAVVADRQCGQVFGYLTVANAIVATGLDVADGLVATVEVIFCAYLLIMVFIHQYHQVLTVAVEAKVVTV